MSVDRKQWILDAAAKSFTLFGYKATTMDQVAKIAGVGKGTIYTFFSTKEELFDEIMRQVTQEMKLIADRGIDSGRPLIDNLQQVLFEILDFRRKHELLIKLSHEIAEMRTPAAEEAMARLESAIISYMKQKVQEAIDRGELKACDPELAAFMMMKIYIALVFDWEKKHEPLDKQQIADTFRLFLLEGLAV